MWRETTRRANRSRFVCWVFGSHAKSHEGSVRHSSYCGTQTWRFVEKKQKHAAVKEKRTKVRTIIANKCSGSKTLQENGLEAILLFSLMSAKIYVHVKESKSFARTRRLTCSFSSELFSQSNTSNVSRDPPNPVLAIQRDWIRKSNVRNMTHGHWFCQFTAMWLESSNRSSAISHVTKDV